MIYGRPKPRYSGACLKIQDGTLSTEDSQIATSLPLFATNEAESLLLDAYDKFIQSAEVAEEERQETLRRIVELYEVWDKPDRASDWRAELLDSEIK